MHTLSKHIHSRVEQFLGFSPVRQKNEVYIAVRFFPELPRAGQFRTFLFQFLFFASPHSANHAVIVVSLCNVSVCM